MRRHLLFFASSQQFSPGTGRRWPRPDDASTSMPRRCWRARRPRSLWLPWSACEPARRSQGQPARRRSA